MTPVPSQDERELLGDSDRAGHVERGSGIRHVANSTINAGTAELNRSGLQYTVPRRDSLFVHTSHLVDPDGHELSFARPLLRQWAHGF